MGRHRDPADIINQTFGRLTVREFIGRGKRGIALYRCDCACGSQHTALRSSLITGRVKSCGCLKRAKVSFEERTKYQTAEMKRARAMKDEKVPYRIIIHR